MTSAVEELKIRARLLRKALSAQDPAAMERAAAVARQRRWTIPDAWTLGLCLNVVAAEAGFEQWHHARTMLGGAAGAGDDLGRFWYDKACAMLLNHWFAAYDDACASLRLRPGRYLLPYGRQFVVVEAPFVTVLGLDPAAAEWLAVGRDLVGGYGSEAWRALAEKRLRHMQLRGTA